MRPTLHEVASDELRAIVGDDSRLGFQVPLLGSLQDHFDIGFSHRLTQIPMHEETTESIQNAAQVIEGGAQVDVGNVDMPVLMGCSGCSKPVPLRDGLLFHRDNNPACFNTRQTLAGLTATTSASSIMNARQ
jgi:hypothetical protein